MEETWTKKSQWAVSWADAIRLEEQAENIMKPATAQA